MVLAVNRSLITKKIFLVLSIVLFDILFLNSQVSAKEFNFFWDTTGGNTTNVACTCYGEEGIVPADFKFFNQKGKTFLARKRIGKSFVFYAGEYKKDAFFKNADATGVLKVTIPEDEDQDVNCVAYTGNSGSHMLFQKDEDIKTKGSYITVSEAMGDIKGANKLNIVSLSHNPITAFEIFVYSKDGKLLEKKETSFPIPGVRTISLPEGEKTIHVEPNGPFDAKYVAYIDAGKTYLKSKESFKEGKLLPARGSLLLTNTYFTPALFTYNIFEKDKIKYQGYMYIPPYAQKVVDLETYTEDFTDPTIKLVSTQAYIPTKCPKDYPKSIPLCNMMEKDALYLLAEVVQNTYRRNGVLDATKDYEVENSIVAEGNEFEIPFSMNNFIEDIYLSIYQQEEGKGKVVLISKKTGKEESYEINGNEELKVNLSDISDERGDTIHVISQNKISVIYEHGSGILSFRPTRVYENEILNDKVSLLDKELPMAQSEVDWSREDCPPSLPGDGYEPEESDLYTKNTTSIEDLLELLCEPDDDDPDPCEGYSSYECDLLRAKCKKEKGYPDFVKAVEFRDPVVRPGEGVTRYYNVYCKKDRKMLVGNVVGLAGRMSCMPLPLQRGEIGDYMYLMEGDVEDSPIEIDDDYDDHAQAIYSCAKSARGSWAVIGNADRMAKYTRCLRKELTSSSFSVTATFRSGFIPRDIDIDRSVRFTLREVGLASYKDITHSFCSEDDYCSVVSYLGSSLEANEGSCASSFDYDGEHFSNDYYYFISDPIVYPEYKKLYYKVDIPVSAFVK